MDSRVIDIQRVKETFADYTRGYNPEDPKIALKIAHTYRVADHCREIALSLLEEGEVLPCEQDEDIADIFADLSWLSGMLHDIGRFEQVRIYNTFIDSKSVDHAQFGADLLFGKDRMIERFIDERRYDDMLETAIRNHNRFRIEEGISGYTEILSHILRDADKVDILRVNIETPMVDIYNTTEEILYNAPVSPEVIEQIKRHQTVTREVRKTPADHLMGHMALMFELVYPRSREIAKREGYLQKMFDFPTKNPVTKDAIQLVKAELETVEDR